MKDAKNPLLNVALAAARAESCRICGSELTHHEMLGDQILAASNGGGKQMHRRCWEILSAAEREGLKAIWLAADIADEQL